MKRKAGRARLSRPWPEEPPTDVDERRERVAIWEPGQQMSGCSRIRPMRETTPIRTFEPEDEETADVVDMLSGRER